MGRTRNLSPWAYWRLRHDSLADEDPCPADDPAQLAEWRTRAATRLRRLLGELADLVPPDLEVLEESDGPGYRRIKVIFDSEAAMSVPALLLVPHEHRGPGPAVLAIHGHGHTKESICAPDAGEDGANYGHRFAQAGYVVLAPDLRCFGERADWQPDDHYHCDVNLVHAFAAGEVPLTQNLWDLARCLDVLAARPEVDAARLGVAGWSYGATCALFLAAVDERVAAAAVSCFFSSWRAAHRVPWNLCGSQVLPGFLGRLEHLDLGALVAPRPLVLSNGTDDVLFPADTARAEFRKLRAVYAASGAEEAAALDVFDGGHLYNAAPIEAFFDRWLR